MFTAIVGITTTADDGFDLFARLRRPLRNAVDYRRRSHRSDPAGWRAFALAGALELDQFEAGDFRRLGDRKQAQYRTLGFDPRQARGPQWVTTIHGLVHVGALGSNAVMRLLGDLIPVVHLQSLDARKGLIENAEGVLGYAAKVGLTTALASNDVIHWSSDVVADYVEATMRCSHGRQGFKLSIRPSRPPRTKKRQTDRTYFAEPMPILL